MVWWVWLLVLSGATLLIGVLAVLWWRRRRPRVEDQPPATAAVARARPGLKLVSTNPECGVSGLASQISLVRSDGTFTPLLPVGQHAVDLSVGEWWVRQHVEGSDVKTKNVVGLQIEWLYVDVERHPLGSLRLTPGAVTDLETGRVLAELKGWSAAQTYAGPVHVERNCVTAVFRWTEGEWLPRGELV